MHPLYIIKNNIPINIHYVFLISLYIPILYRNKILHLNEERKKSSNAFEKNIENFISENINRHAQKYTELRKRSKKVISTIISYLNVPKGFIYMHCYTFFFFTFTHI